MEKRKVVFSRLKRRFLKHLWLGRSVLVLAILVALLITGLGLNLIAKKTGLSVYTSFARDFLFAPQHKIASFAGRTNVLILGKSGVGYDSPDLTDTIILTSIFFERRSVSLISLPRDIWVSDLRAKLNSAYYWGNQKEVGGGLVLAKAIVEEIVGEPVHYSLVIDFNGFKDLIDTVGGIELEVENAFTDERYPIPGRENDFCQGDLEFKCRYETLRFARGKQLMDGETALKFVRSRNALGEEGTDLARAARQQKIITALKNKILSKEVFLNPKKVRALFKTIRNSIETDMRGSELAVFTRALFNARNAFKTYTLPEELLLVPPASAQYDYLYVFVPQKGDWSEIHTWIESILP